MTKFSVAKYKLRKYRDEIRWARQRVSRGWDERAYWSTNTWLAQHLGKVLLYTSQHLHGFPSDYPGGFSEWASDMQVASFRLLYYAENDSKVEEARMAMRWVTDHFEHLWD